jgi:hypothetical protein
MLYVSLIVEVLRTRPARVFWSVVLAQALLWTLVPALFYSAPPGDLASVIAIGHELQLGTSFGPPLAFWAAEAAYDAFGLFGVYLLAQACVVVAYWAIFKLASAIVGPRQAGLALLLMVGISALTVPTPEFGPSIAVMPVWALILLHYWRALVERRGEYWFALAIECGLLLLISAAGIILLGLLALFTLATRRGRAALAAMDPWIAAIVAIVIGFPYLVWLFQADDVSGLFLRRLQLPGAPAHNPLEWARLFGVVVVAHAGFALLVLLASGWPQPRRAPPAAIERVPLDSFAKAYVYFFALVPALVATILAALTGRAVPLGGLAPLVLLSGLAVIVAAGDRIGLYHQRTSAYAWFCLLIVPAAMTVAAIVVLPWTLAVDLRVAQPADAMGLFFAESFQRRTGTPLTIVAGETPTAALVALRAPSRPSVLFGTARSPWATPDDIRMKGAVVVWRATDARGTPPPAISERYPDLVPEVRAFERPVEGRLPLLRIGWGLIRPQREPAAPPAR